MSPARNYVRNTTVRLAILVILLVLLSAASMLTVLYHSHLTSLRSALAHQQQTNATLIYNQVAFYQETVEKLAHSVRVKDLLNVGTHKEVREWSAEVQHQIPNNIGLALVRPGVDVLGDKSMLGLGASCIVDMHRMENSELEPRPPVHTDNPQLEHFDLIAPVTGQDGQRIGSVFASFTLNILQRTLDTLARPGQVQRIRDGAGNPLVQAGTNLPGNLQLDHSESIPHTDWVLEIRSSIAPQDEPMRQSSVITTLVISVTIIITVGFFAWRVADQHYRLGH